MTRQNTVIAICKSRAEAEAAGAEPPHTGFALKQFLLLLAVLGLAVLGSGCAAVSALPLSSVLGSPNGSALEIHSHTEVRLQEANFIVTKTNVVGQSDGFSLLGVLTIVPPKFSKAMNRLYTQAEMQPGRSQTLANLIMEKNSTYLILFSLPRISIRADVIEFIPVTATNIPPRLSPTEKNGAN